MAQKRKKPRSIAFNIGVVMLLLCVVGGLVFLAKSRDRSVQLILPEEHAAREARRAAPENGFSVLLEAAKLLPARPNATDEGSTDQGNRHWEERDSRPLGTPSIAAMCRIELPDSDPQVAQYALACAPAAAKAREALAKPYVLFPEARQFKDDSYESEILGVARGMIALGRVQFEATPTEDALAPLVDAIKLARLLCQDEALLTWAKEIEGRALQQVRQLGLVPARRAVLDGALAALGPGYLPRSVQLKTLFLHIDDQLARQATSADMRPERRMFRGVFLYELQRLAVLFRDNKDTMYQLTDEGPLSLDVWLYKNARADRGPGDPSGAARRINLSMRRSGELLSDFEATRIALALAAFHAEKGAYPATLAELVPAHLPAIPNDPFNGAPFGYKTTDPNAYLLYGPGYDAADNGGDPEADRIIEQVPPLQ